MQFSTYEWRVLAVLALKRGEAGLDELKHVFDRGAQLARAVDGLRRFGLVTSDPVGGRVRLLEKPVFEALGLDVSTLATELFPDERPLDGALAEVQRVALKPPDAQGKTACVKISGAQVQLPVASSVHLVSERCKSHLPGEATGTGVQRPDAAQIVQWLKGTTPEVVWKDWGGWWVTVARNNPDRVERAYEKLKSAGPVRSAGAFMRARINEFAAGL